MPNKSFEVPVEPAVMKWARESAGRTIEDTAKRLGADKELINGWELGKKNPTIAQLRTLTKYYQRSLDVFLLSEPPTEPLLPCDFRNLPTGAHPPFHAETRFALRKALRLQSVSAELKGKFQGEIFSKLGNVAVSDDPELIADEVRHALGADIEGAPKCKDEGDALKQWIKIIEGMDIIVTQMPMPIGDVRAFSLVGDARPIIVLNVSDYKNARIFSLFHELGHILIKEGGICDPWSYPEICSPKKSVEAFCNRFAGAFLVPKECLIKHPQVISKENKNVWSEKSLQSLSKSFKVSKEVILRRLLIFGYTTHEFYNEKRRDWAILEEQKQKEKEKQNQEEDQDNKKTRGGGGRNVARECIQQNGAPIVSLILESYYDNRLNKCDVADYLEVSLKHLPKIEKALWS